MKQVVDLLTAHGFLEEAAALERESAKLTHQDEVERASAIWEISNMCQPRWLGDLNVSRIPLLEWFALLGRASAWARTTSKTSPVRPRRV